MTAVTVQRCRLDRIHAITLTSTVDGLDPTLPHIQTLSSRYFISKECDDVSQTKGVCITLASINVVRKHTGSLFRPEEPHIAVLGGGITGLSSAYHLARKFPTTKITLIEGSNHVGGWLDSHRVNVGGGTVLLEKGPRTLRSSSKATSELVSVRHLSYMQ